MSSLTYSNEVYERIIKFLEDTYGYTKAQLEAVSSHELLHYLPRAKAADAELRNMLDEMERTGEQMAPAPNLARDFSNARKGDVEREQFVGALFTLAHSFDITLDMNELLSLTLAELIPIFRNVSTRCAKAFSQQRAALKLSIPLPEPVFVPGQEVHLLAEKRKGFVHSVRISTNTSITRNGAALPSIKYIYDVDDKGIIAQYVAEDLREVRDVT